MTSQSSKIEKIIEILFKNRDIKTGKEKQEFLNPPSPEKYSTKDLGINPGQLKKAILRIKKAIEEKERIVVWGDYDVDGICAAGVLWETLHFLGAKVLPFIPSRFTEGYGLNIESIKKLKEEDPNLGLLITVDHGITGNDKVDFAKELGIDVIVTDHHEPGEDLPRALAVVHTTKISGSAVAYVLASKITQIRNSKFEIRNLPTDHLGLVCLGTVADVLPLVGFNRSFVVHGLEELRRTNRPGINSLCSEAGVKQEEIGTFHIGFVIAPRLNAMGRLEHAMDSLRLLCTRSRGRAEKLAFKLGRTNRLRQDKTEVMFAHIQENFEKVWMEDLPPVLLAHHGSYEEGVVGIVAGRLVEKYYRPTIVVSEGEETSKASARSIKGVNIVELIRKAGEGILLSAGGHPMAAGLTIETKNIKLFHQNLLKYSQQISRRMFKRQTRMDCEIGFGDISEDLVGEIEKFAPFGFGNPEPVFLTKGVYVEDVRSVGRDGKHLKMKLTQLPSNLAAQQPSYPAIGFGMGDLYAKLSFDKQVDIVYSLSFNEWNGKRSLQLKVKEIQ